MLPPTATMVAAVGGQRGGGSWCPAARPHARTHGSIHTRGDRWAGRQRVSGRWCYVLLERRWCVIRAARRMLLHLQHVVSLVEPLNANCMTATAYVPYTLQHLTSHLEIAQFTCDAGEPAGSFDKGRVIVGSHCAHMLSDRSCDSDVG